MTSGRGVQDFIAVNTQQDAIQAQTSNNLFESASDDHLAVDPTTCLHPIEPTIAPQLLDLSGVNTLVPMYYDEIPMPLTIIDPVMQTGTCIPMDSSLASLDDAQEDSDAIHTGAKYEIDSFFDHELGSLFRRRVRSKSKGAQKSSLIPQSGDRQSIRGTINQDAIGFAGNAYLDTSPFPNHDTPNFSKQAYSPAHQQEILPANDPTIPVQAVSHFNIVSNDMNPASTIEAFSQHKEKGKLVDKEEYMREPTMIHSSLQDMSPQSMAISNIKISKKRRRIEADSSPSKHSTTTEGSGIQRISIQADSSSSDGSKMLVSQTRYLCPKPNCDKHFSTNGHARRHSRIHDNIRPYLCSNSNCPATFTRKDNLRQHQKAKRHYS